MFRRQDDGEACHSGRNYNESEYNLGLHVASLFVVLAVSSLACAFPLLVLRFPRLRIPARVLFVVRHFGEPVLSVCRILPRLLTKNSGTGVLIATAFVHLLPTAFISLGDPCLSSFWTDDYPAMPGAIALLGIFAIAGIEMTFSPEKRCCAAPMTSSPIVRDSGLVHDHQSVDDEERMGNAARQRGANFSTAQRQQEHEHSSDEEFNPDEKIRLTAEQEHEKAFMQCVLLEMGILFHSVFIGMNLSVSAGKEFVILWIAIVFHRKSSRAGFSALTDD